MKNRDCHVSKLGAKHLGLVGEYLGLPIYAWPNTFNVTGQFYLINKPEHLSETEFVPFEVPKPKCPYCDAICHWGLDGIVTPLICASCGRTGWIYDPLMDLDKNWDTYQDKAQGVTDKHRLWDELGIPSI